MGKDYVSADDGATQRRSNTTLHYRPRYATDHEGIYQSRPSYKEVRQSSIPKNPADSTRKLNLPTMNLNLPDINAKMALYN